jgi:ribA/ribD-fused uncharacterized protein
MEDILFFKDEYEFLSNFSLSKIEYEDLVYPTVEHAYQAQKTLNKMDRKIISEIPSDKPGRAKYAGRAVLIRPDWEDIKFQIMYELVTLKFKNKVLRNKLVATDDAKLEEGNWWNDTQFGVYKGQGLNWLGRILMMVRAEIIVERELNKLARLLDMKSIKRTFRRNYEF